MAEPASAIATGVVGAPMALVGLGFWTPQAPRMPALLAPSDTEANSLPPGELLGARARGRASLLTLMFAEVAQQAADAANMPLEAFATVFGSAYGEMERLMQLLQTMQSPGGEVSPLRFQTSVHNASAGQISIVAKNQRFSTSVAAGPATVQMTFVEAACWMYAHAAPLLVVLGDESPPPRLSLGAPYPPLAAALAFSPDAQAPATAPRLRLRCDVASASPAASNLLNAGNNPCAVLPPLITWLSQNHGPGIFPLSNESTPGYGIERT